MKDRPCEAASLGRATAMLGDDPRYGRRADVVEARHLGAGFAARDDAVGDLFALTGIELLSSAADTSLGASGGEASGGSLSDHGAFER
jgi:hypothetical protein